MSELCFSKSQKKKNTDLQPWHSYQQGFMGTEKIIPIIYIICNLCHHLFDLFLTVHTCKSTGHFLSYNVHVCLLQIIMTNNNFFSWNFHGYVLLVSAVSAVLKIQNVHIILKAIIWALDYCLITSTTRLSPLKPAI